MSTVNQNQLGFLQEKPNEQRLCDEIYNCKIENEILEQELRKSTDIIKALKDERFKLKLEHNNTISLLKVIILIIL